MAVVDSRVHVDASAAKSIVERGGLGKVRHLEVVVFMVPGATIEK